MNENNVDNNDGLTLSQNQSIRGNPEQSATSDGQQDMSNTTTWEKIVSLLSSTGPRSFAVVLGVLYVVGFLVVSAHLNRYGVFDLDIANVRYLAAGAVYSFYIIMFSLFGGRGIIFGKKWMQEHIESLRSRGTKEWWVLLAFIHSIIHVTFLVCLSAAAFSTIAFAFSETIFFYGFLGLAFLVDYIMDVGNLDIRYPRFYLIVQLAIKMPAIVIFFSLSESSKPIVVFFSYLVIVFFLNLVLDQFERYRISSDRVVFSTIYIVIFFLITAVSFGTLFYGDISRKIGGGLYIEANIAVEKDYNDILSDKGQSLPNGDVKIIHVTDKYMFIEMNDKIIRIPETVIKSLVFKKPTRNDAFKLWWSKTLRQSTTMPEETSR